MNYGHYYKLNTQKSDLTHNVTVFDYVGVVSQKRGTHNVYLIIIDDGIHFEYHFHNDIDSSHVHADIAFLPFVSTIDGHKRLACVVEECHDVTFPAEIDDSADTPVKIYNPFLDFTDIRLNGGGYSGLAVFEVGTAEQNGNIIRRMLLDFLFDMEHSEVFQVSPYYDKMREVFNSNTLISAILARAEYYYQRKQQRDKRDILEDSIKAKLIYADDFTQAEKQWVDFFCSEYADRLLAESAWLAPKKGRSFVARELNMVYHSRPNDMASCDYVNSIYPNEIKYKNKKKELQHRVRQTALQAQSAYLHHYNLAGVWHTWFGGGIFAKRNLFPLGLLDSLLPRLLAAIIAAWFTIYQHMNNFMEETIHINIVMIVLLLFYVFYEIRKKNVYLSSVVIGTQTFLLLVVAFCYSFIVRLMMINIIAIAPCPCEKARDSLPLLLPVTISVFIGIFIHMLFENKSITES